MSVFANLSIRNKIAGIILTSTLLAVGVGFTVVFKTSVQNFETTLKREAQLIAQVVGSYNAIHLHFGKDSADDARDDIEKLLRLTPNVVQACLFDNADQVFTCYAPPNNFYSPPIEIPERSLKIRDAEVFVFEPVTKTIEDESEGVIGEEIKLGTIYLRMTTGDLPQQIRRFQISMLVLLTVVVGAAIVLAYFLQGFISKPILDLARRAEYISQNADYSIRVQKPGSDEIGLLYDGFNEMLAQIQGRQEDLERSNRDLDQFAYVASHDLKAPLRAISTLSSWIEEDLGDRLSGEGKEQMRLLRSRVTRMDALIEGILRYSRVGRTSAHDEVVDVGALLHEVAEILAPPEGFTIEIGPGMPSLTTSRLRLEQIFSNLINNAIKYHDKEKGLVQITVSRQEGFYEFTVADDGPGIAPEHQERVFRMFQTLQPRDKVESTGLGLALVKKLVEEEGGHITLDSEVGQGAKFRFTWPVDRALISTSG